MILTVHGKGIPELNGDLLAGGGHGSHSHPHGGLIDKLEFLHGAKHDSKQQKFTKSKECKTTASGHGTRVL